jgi:hypothetical protein
MFHPYRLPNFMDYLYVHYQQLYNLYLGRLTELFPSSSPDDNNLLIIKDETTSEENNEFIMQLWKRFTSWSNSNNTK